MLQCERKHQMCKYNIKLHILFDCHYQHSESGVKHELEKKRFFSSLIKIIYSCQANYLQELLRRASDQIFSVNLWSVRCVVCVVWNRHEFASEGTPSATIDRKMVSIGQTKI